MYYFPIHIFYIQYWIMLTFYPFQIGLLRRLLKLIHMTQKHQRRLRRRVKSLRRVAKIKKTSNTNVSTPKIQMSSINHFYSFVSINLNSDFNNTMKCVLCIIVSELGSSRYMTSIVIFLGTTMLLYLCHSPKKVFDIDENYFFILRYILPLLNMI